jgi:predicted transcriptional regulator
VEDTELTSEHVRAARALLRWDQKTLAHHAGVSLPTIGRLESKPGRLAAYLDTVQMIRSALEGAGIKFLNGDKPGVRLQNPVD